MTQKNLQTAIRRERRGQRRKALRYPAKLREAVVEFVRGERSRGTSLISLADALDLPINTLSRWCEKYERGSRLAPVEVVSGGPADGPVLVTPSGHRVEGLSVESLFQLLERLR
jgi:transposase-like protein